MAEIEALPHTGMSDVRRALATSQPAKRRQQHYVS